MPPILTQTVLVLLGITLGSLVSRQLIQHMSAYPLTIGLLALATFCSTFGCSFYLQRFHGWDQTSALLAGKPRRAVADHHARRRKGRRRAGDRRGADHARDHSHRRPAAGAGADRDRAVGAAGVAAVIASPLELAALIAAAVAVALLLRLVKFPASWMFGAMIASSVLHGTGLIEGGLPPWMRGVALVGIGAVIGTRFARMKNRRCSATSMPALGSFAVAIIISAIFVAVIVLTTNVRFADVVVAFAPGAMDAMLALALTLHIDPIFVGAHHLSRFVFVSITTPGIVHLFGRPQEDVDD